jgi:hypothetical protein
MQKLAQIAFGYLLALAISLAMLAGVGRCAITSDFLQAATPNTTTQTTYTFASQNLGTADADRYIVVGIEARGTNSGLVVSSATIGGQSATITRQVTNATSNFNIAALIIAAVPSGTTGDIVINFNVAALRCNVKAWRLTGISGVTAADSDSSTASPPSVALDVPAGGWAVGSAVSAIATSTTWTGLTENHDTQIAGSITGTAASDDFASAQTGLTITATFNTNTNPAGVFASWAEDSGGGGGSTVPVILHRLQLMGALDRPHRFPLVTLTRWSDLYAFAR